MLADPAHREVARVAAERSIVLLRNEHNLLPLGVLLAGGCPMTVAVKTTDWPKTEGFTELFTLAVELAFTA